MLNLWVGCPSCYEYNLLANKTRKVIMRADRIRLKKKEMAVSTSVCWQLLDYVSRTDIIAIVEAVHKNKWPLQTVSQNKYQLCKKKQFKGKCDVLWKHQTKYNIICLLRVPAKTTLILLYLKAAHSGAVGWGTVLQTRRSWVWLPMVPLECFIDVILSATLWPWGRLNL
jgi:hypothetical protein